MKKEKILTKQTPSINTMKNVTKFYHLPKFVVFSDSSSSESFVFFFPCFSFSAFCLKYLTRRDKVIYSLCKISQLPNKHWNGENYPHETNHKYDTQSTPIVVILYYLTLSRKIPILFVCKCQKKRMTFDNVENYNLVPRVLSYPSLLGRTATEEGLFDNVADSDLQEGAPRSQSRRKEG